MVKILPFLMISIIFWIFWFPGPRVATDFHFTNKSIQQSGVYPYAWRDTGVSDGLGEYNVPSLWSQPLHTVVGLSSYFLDFNTQTKILGLIALLIGYLGIWRLLNFLDQNLFGKIIGSTFFLINSYSILLFDGGQLSLVLALNSLPHIIYYFYKLILDNSWNQRLNLTFWVLLTSFFDFRILYIYLIIFISYLFFQMFISFQTSLKLVKNLFLSGFFIFIVLLGVHSYWLLPAIVAKSIELPLNYGRSSQIDFLSFSTLTHALFLQQPHWYKNIFGDISSVSPEFVLIPLLILLTPLLSKKNKEVGFWMMMSLIGIFLVKGSNPPLSYFYQWLFISIPGFSLFRDPSKFYFIVVISYSILIAQSISILSRKYLTFVVLILIYLIFLIRPIFSDQMTGLLSFPNYQHEYASLHNFLKGDNTFGRILWIPGRPNLTFENNLHPGISTSKLVQKRPFAIGVKGTYETFNFLREAPYMGELFTIAGIKYIVYPYLDIKRQEVDQDRIKYYYTFLNQLSDLTWIKKSNLLGIPLLETFEYKDKFFGTANLWWIIGSDNIYNVLSADLKLSNNALVFSEEYVGLGNRLEEFPEAKIVLNNKTKIDLAASFIDFSYLIFPAKQLDFSPNKSGWWKREASDLISWRDFLTNKYGLDNQDFDLGGGWAVAEGSLNLSIKLENDGVDRILLARILESSRSGSLKFYQSNNLIGEVKTDIEGSSNIRWFEVGKLYSNDELIIKSSGDINLVNALALIEQSKWQNLQEKANKLNERVSSFTPHLGEENTVNISFNQVNSTRYEIDVSSIDKSFMLIFSQNYDSFWEMNGVESIPVYSLLNGFRIEKNGRYIVNFKPQNYVDSGLKITFVSLSLLLFLSILIKAKKAKSKL